MRAVGSVTPHLTNRQREHRGVSRIRGIRSTKKQRRQSDAEVHSQGPYGGVAGNSGSFGNPIALNFHILSKVTYTFVDVVQRPVKS